MTANPTGLLLKNLLHQGVTWAPDQEIIYRDRARFTYRQFEERVRRLAGALISMGIGESTRVGVIEWDTHRYLEMYFGIPGIGATMHMINPRLAPDDLLFTIQHAEDTVIFFHEDFLPLIEKLRPGLTTVQRYILISESAATPLPGWVDMTYESLLAGAAPLAELPDLDENTLATISYTTGTTGTPRGAYFSQRQLTLQTLCDAVALAALGGPGVTKHDVYMPITPMYHGHAWGMPYVATMLGLKMIFPGRYEPAMLVRLLREHHVTFSHCIPTILQMILFDPSAEGADFAGWRVIIGGATMPKSLAYEARKRGAMVYGGYGLTETAPVLTISNLKPFMESWDEDRQIDWLIKPGFTIPLVQMKIVGDDGREVPRDNKTTGEVLVRSPWCTAGYLKEESLSKDLWAGGWLHTGDVGTIDEYGYITIVDRIKDIIKSGGEWIVSLELERLIGQHPGVKEVAVIGIPDAHWGERPLALVVPRPSSESLLTTASLLDHLKTYVDSGLITSASIPNQVVFVEEIAKTSVGKHDKKLLRQQYRKYGSEG